MPSGSHGGSRGSHSSGGSRSSSGSSSFGGSFFGGGTRRGHHHSRSNVLIFGRTYHLGKPIGIVALILMIAIFFSFITMFAGFAIMPSEKKEIEKIKEDYYYYQDIISLGNFTTAEVTDIFSNAGKYYITYSIDLPNSYLDSVYTRSEAMHLLSVGEVQVALNKPLSQADFNTDSIPTDYKNMPLTNDGEYLMALKGLKTSRICAYAGLSVMVGAIIILVVMSKKSAKKESTQTTSSSTPQTTDNPQQYLTCPHCGCKIRPHQNSCSACGNKLK